MINAKNCLGIDQQFSTEDENMAREGGGAHFVISGNALCCHNEGDKGATGSIGLGPEILRNILQCRKVLKLRNAGLEPGSGPRCQLT